MSYLAGDGHDTQTRPPPAGGSSAGAYLVVFHGDTSQVFHLPQVGAVVVGRGEEATLRFDDESLSRRHAAILCAEDEIAVDDLDSHNGTWVNGERVSGRRSLAGGDAITIGQVLL